MLILYRFSLLYTFHFIDCYYSNMYGLWNSVNRWTWVQPHTDIYLKKELSSCIFLHLQKDVTLLTSHGSHCLNSDLQTEPLLSHFDGNDGSDLSRWRYRLFLSLWLHPEKKQTHVDAYMAWHSVIYMHLHRNMLMFGIIYSWQVSHILLLPISCRSRKDLKALPEPTRCCFHSV